MSVGFRFLGTISRHQPARDEDGYWYTEAAGRTLGDVLAAMALTEADTGWFALVNGLRRTRAYVLEDGDRVCVIGPEAGS